MTRHWFLAGLASLSLAAAGCSTMHHKGENEVKMSINDVPASVRSTLQTASNGAKITTVDKEMKDGKTVYEADAMIDGKNYEILISEDGKLISKKLDNEDDEKARKEKEDDDDKSKRKG